MGGIFDQVFITINDPPIGVDELFRTMNRHDQQPVSTKKHNRNGSVHGNKGNIDGERERESAKEMLAMIKYSWQ